MRAASDRGYTVYSIGHYALHYDCGFCNLHCARWAHVGTVTCIALCGQSQHRQA